VLVTFRGTLVVWLWPPIEIDRKPSVAIVLELFLSFQRMVV
jgi:hypothetical protein